MCSRTRSRTRCEEVEKNLVGLSPELNDILVRKDEKRHPPLGIIMFHYEG